MSNHPLNLAFRFLLELAGLAAMGYWGWQQGSGWVRFAAAVLVPLAASVLWGTFRVPDDPGKAPVPVPGFVRLLLEAAFFGFAAWGLFDRRSRLLGLGVCSSCAGSLPCCPMTASCGCCESNAAACVISLNLTDQQGRQISSYNSRFSTLNSSHPCYNTFK